MRITNTTRQEIGLIATGQAEAPSAPPPSVGTAKGTAAADGYTPSPELAQFLARVQQQPEVRTDLLTEVARRIDQGFYATPASATQTAEALLNAIE